MKPVFIVVIGIAITSVSLASEVDDIRSLAAKHCSDVGGMRKFLLELDSDDRWILIDRLRGSGGVAVRKAVLLGLRSCDPEVSPQEYEALSRHLQLSLSRLERTDQDWAALARLRAAVHAGRVQDALKTAGARPDDADGVFAVLWEAAAARASRDAGDRMVAAEMFVRSARAASKLGWTRKRSLLIRQVFARHFSEETPYWLSLDRVALVRRNLKPDECLVAYSAIGDELLRLLVRPDSVTVDAVGRLSKVVKLATEFASPSAGAHDALRGLRGVLGCRLDSSSLGARVVVVPQTRLRRIPWSLVFRNSKVRCLPMRLIFRIGEPVESRGRGGLTFGLDSPRMAKIGGAPTVATSDLREFTRVAAARSRWRAMYWNAEFLPRVRRYQLPRDDGEQLETAALVHMAVRADVLVMSGRGAGSLEPAKRMGGGIWIPDAERLRSFDALADLVADSRRRVRSGKLGPLFVVGELSPMAIVPQWDTTPAATAKFLLGFHRSIASGSRVREALESGRDAVARTAGWNGPHYWAGWELWGFRED